MHKSCRRKEPRGEETEEEESNAGRMASGPAATLWQWLEDAVRLLRRTVGYGERQREPTYTELLLEQLNNWTSELGMVTVVVLGAIWLIVKLGNRGSDGNASKERVTSSSSSEDSKCTDLSEPLFTADLLHLCGQKEALRFSDVMNLSDTLFVFLTETHFSEVFMLGGPQGGWVAKIVPVNKSTIGLASEVLIARELNNLRYREDFRTELFAKLLGAKCVRDVYPSVLLETQRMVRRSTAPLGFVMCDTEPFLVIEYAVGGVRLSEIMIENMEQVHSIVAQVILGLAIAEEALQFEHRDIQMDNVLVKMTSNETSVFICNRKKIVLHTRGVIACVIDFNLSRATIDGRAVYYDPRRHFTTDFLEERSSMAFDTMRGALRNNWSTFLPETNVQGALQFLYEVEIFLRNQDYEDSALSTIRSLKTELNQYRALSTFASRSTVLPKLLLLKPKLS